MAAIAMSLSSGAGRANTTKTPSKSAIAAAAGLIIVPRALPNKQSQQLMMGIDSGSTTSRPQTPRLRDDEIIKVYHRRSGNGSSSWFVRPVHHSHADLLVSNATPIVSTPHVPDMSTSSDGTTLKDGVVSMLNLLPLDADGDDASRNSLTSVDHLLPATKVQMPR